MERYEMLNRALMPVDELIGMGLEGLKKIGFYDPLKEGVVKGMVAMQQQNFKANNKLEILGAENVPATGGCLIASNHASWLDVQVLAASAPRRFFFVAKADFREWPMLRRMIELGDGISVRRGGDPRALVESRGMKQVTDLSAIEKVVDGIIAANPDKAAQVKDKPQSLGWFVGQVMKSSGGKANPQAVNELLKSKLGI